MNSFIDKTIFSKFIDKLVNREVKGKGLSTNDYSNNDKEKLNSLPNINELINSFNNKDVYKFIISIDAEEFMDIINGNKEEFALENKHIKFYKNNTLISDLSQIQQLVKNIYHDNKDIIVQFDLIYDVNELGITGNVAVYSTKDKGVMSNLYVDTEYEDMIAIMFECGYFIYFYKGLILFNYDVVENGQRLKEINGIITKQV